MPNKTLRISEEAAESLGIKKYPYQKFNSARAIYGSEAFLVQAGDFIYNVPEEAYRKATQNL